ncbi:aspartyl/asparaginyl beta-hydroxylase (cupin superfamily) [Catenulispora sp. MAP12-49]|uniref:aspartyl/asparaginyl beta-hydroxylase domain-containing protein n=1 Tax=Catenulispora sp. MAP12-49 TaxID=3156302 RepID=UPI003510FF02
MESMGPAGIRAAGPAGGTDQVELLRKQYEALICELLGRGRGEQAYQIADIAVAQGLWEERLHRPITLHPATGSEPFFDPADFWFLDLLAENWPQVRAEIDSVADPVAAGMSTAGLDGSSVRGGKWHQLMFWDRGRRFERAHELFPVTAELLSAIPEATEFGNGFVMLSWLQPGTWIAPHCGPTNSKARTHFCIRTDPKARMRVGDQERGWEDGQSFVFDDSFEHEVWHEGDGPRVVLLIDVPNPRLVDAERVRRQDQAAWTEEMQTFMSAMQLSRVSREAEGVSTVFSEPVLEFIESYLDTRDLQAVEFRHGALQVTPASASASGRQRV